MSKLHRSQYDAQVFEPNEGQCRLLCSNKASSHCPSLSLKEIFDTETIMGIEELGDVLGKIHKRLIGEGYIVKRGKIYKNEN